MRYMTVFVSKKHQKLVLNLGQPDRVLSVIPTAKLFEFKGHKLLAVPHRLDEVRVLRNLGIKAPAPIETHYRWPGKYPKPFEHQRKMAAFMTLNPRCFNLGDMGCVDADTEYLSPTGWVRISEYTGGKVAQYNPETDAAEFVDPQEYVKLPCPTMLHFKTKYGIDQLLSPEHRMLLVTKDEPGRPARREVVQAIEAAARHDAWVARAQTKRDATKISWSRASIPVVFSVQGGAGLRLTDAQVRLQVAVIADGHFPPNNTNRCVVRLKRKRKIERMRALLCDAGVEFSEREQNTSTAQGFVVFTFNAPTRDKSFGPSWWEATVEQLRVVADEVLRWDGSVSTTKPTKRFSTSVRESADFVQYAFVSTGKTARVIARTRADAVEYEVLVRDNGNALQLASMTSDGRRRSVVSVVNSPDGFKYCFMVPSTFLVFRRNGCVFVSGNTGKTLATLWAYHYLREAGVVRKAVVLSPLSTLERAWGDEIFTNFSDVSFGVVYGSRDRRLKILDTDHDLYLLNHDALRIKPVLERLLAMPDLDLVIVDECAEFRNSGTGRWRALHKLTQKTPYVWGLTGTPTPNEPTDAWGQVRLINPSNVPKWRGAFRDKVMRKVSTFKWVPRDTATEIVQAAMQPSIRYSREECIDLPPTTWQTRSVELSPEQRKAYDEMVRRLKTEVGGEQLTAVNAAVKANKLLQIACGAGYSNTKDAVVLPAPERMAVLREIIEEAPRKVIVFVPIVIAVEEVARQLAEHYSVALIHGEVPKVERDRIFHEFQATANPRVLVAQPGTMSHGLTLTAANTTVWYAPVNSPTTYQQACARITRPGQTHNTLIVHIEGSPVERGMYERLKNKGRMQDLLLNLLREDRD